MKHLTAVRSAQHNKFADENGMYSFQMSGEALMMMMMMMMVVVVIVDDGSSGDS